MAFFKCKMCGGDLDISAGMSIAECQYCGTKQTLPKLDDDKKATLYDRANHFRRNNEFDKAMGIYEQILNEDSADAEAYWSLVLCRYGIEYVEDPASRKRIPTVNRAQFTSVFDDENYKSALQYADGYQRSIYEEEAKAINEIQKGILAISQQEEPFDVFICYKETDANGRRTPDSVLANDLYHQLKQEGFKVFFARITLEDKLGTAYEPYIFAALNSAKVMVVLGTKSEYFNAVWVRNEWSRYLSLIKSGAKKILIPAYKDMDPYDLPEEFAHLQSQDMSKLGFMQDLIRGIKKIASVDEPKTVVREAVQGGGTDKATLLKRAALFLNDGDWKSANEYCEKVLDTDPECAEAYLYKLMADIHAHQESDLTDISEPYLSNLNYKKIILFGDTGLKNKISEFANSTSYNYAVKMMESEQYLIAVKNFEDVVTYRDSLEKITQCKDMISSITEKHRALLNAKKQEEEKINSAYAKGQQEAQRWKSLGAISAGATVFFLVFFFAVIGTYEVALILIGGPGAVVSLIACPFLFMKSNNISAKCYQEKSAALTQLDNKYKPTQAMLNNIEKTQNRQQVANSVKQQSINSSNLCEVLLINAGMNKLQVIAAIREITGIGLADAKNLTDNVPSIIKRAISFDEANQIKYRLEMAGAQTEIR